MMECHGSSSLLCFFFFLLCLFVFVKKLATNPLLRLSLIWFWSPKAPRKTLWLFKGFFEGKKLPDLRPPRWGLQTPDQGTPAWRCLCRRNTAHQWPLKDRTQAQDPKNSFCPKSPFYEHRGYASILSQVIFFGSWIVGCMENHQVCFGV